MPQPLLELAAAAQLLLLAWRLDAAEQRAPGAAAPAPLGALAGRFAEQLDRLGKAAACGGAAAGGGAAGGGAAAGRALLLVQADLLLIFSVSKLRVRVDVDASDSAGRPPCMHCDCQRSWTHDGVRTPRHANSLSVGGHVESSCKCIFTCRLPCILAPLRKACTSKASAQLVWRQQHGAHSPKHATELTAARAGHAGGGRGRRTERRRAGPLCTACGGGAAGYGAAGAG